MDNILQQYADKFGDNFPIMAVLHLEDAEIVKLIKKAIEDNKPYEAEYEDQRNY
ncbi:hypothetical protein [Psychrobacillus sp. FJAT-21963]|uniref:hypothetical protein n=1 Tax=Psychrobacillus sp. FJAT-21963 TaxID=1712028 RepID=UPI0012E16967|nr:hypothetical protein [Psychrobacillus sp. FJAT-21963]